MIGVARFVAVAFSGEIELKGVALRMRGLFVGGAAGLLLSLLMGGHAGSSRAEPLRLPRWGLHAFATPSLFSASETARCESSLENVLCDAFQVTATDVGSASTTGSDVVLSDVVPAGVTVQRAALISPPTARFLTSLGLSIGEHQDVFPLLEAYGPLIEELLGIHAKCTKSPLTCTLPVAIAPDETVELTVYVSVDEGTGGPLVSTPSVSGGGAEEAIIKEYEVPVGSGSPGFGVSKFESLASGLDGGADTQAGGHPYELSTRLDLNNVFRIRPNSTLGITSVQDPKDVVVDLPVGFLGSAVATHKCTFAELSSFVFAGEGGCPKDTIVGHILTEPQTGQSINGPIYNMVPQRGVAAEFAFVDLLAGPHVLFARIVPTSAGYALRVTAPDLPQVPLADVITTFYGNPSEKETGATPSVMFTNPTQCSGEPVAASVHVDSWQNPGPVSGDGQPVLSDPRWVSASSTSPPMTDCDLLRFAAEMELTPQTTVADSPTGVDVDVRVPQVEAPGTLATPPLRDASVTLPVGFTVNPGSADGLGGCSPAQIALGSAAPPTCPESSKIGTVELTTPLLPEPLHGAVYLASQDENPFHSLLAGYIVVDDPQTGIVVKIPGDLTPDTETGQIKAVFNDSPQFPFSELKMHFKGGARGVLATPEACGTFTASAVFSPWSAPDSGPAATPFSSFPISSGCVSGFAPSFTAGSQSTQAGGYTPFVSSFSRADGDEEISKISETLPPGLLARLAGVPLCSSADAQAGSCPEGSRIGSVMSAAGPGPNPLFLPGRIYLTGPYDGAPFGIDVVVPAVAGPFDLGDVVVRGNIRIDANTGQATVASDAIPHAIKGIGIRLRRVDVTLDRPQFTINPTSCEPASVDATFTSTGGVGAAASSRFQVGGCGELPFHPGFSAFTSSRTSKANGASLTVDVTQKPGEANIRKVEVQLPVQLPSRLSTLQKACTLAQFDSNPAGCPAGSMVGSATARTPILSSPLSGPAYLVSHGAAAFPDLEYVLQGEGVTIILDGKTDIKKGITYSRFQTIPDAPIASFQTTLPEGPHSILAANVNLCVSRRHHKRLSAPLKLTIPTTITSQAGVGVRQSTPLHITGCPKRRVHRRKHR